ncbi:MAG: alanine racemase [Candidatus Krumholzibacteriia bacterium]
MTSTDAAAWLRIRVDTAALRDNVAGLRALVRRPALLMPVVKSEGYGHGLELAARAFVAGGADWLGVHAVAEAERLRRAGVELPVLVMGPVLPGEAVRASALGCDVTVGSLAALRDAATAGPLRIHLKVETGVNRQGLVEDELPAALDLLAAHPDLRLVGVSSHFADIEDTTDHRFARRQRERFEAWCARLSASSSAPLLRHMSCSAAAVLWPDAHHDLVRVGIAAYGVWPSPQTLVSARAAGRDQLGLRPAVTWAVRVSQVRRVPAGETVGYGRTWLAPVDSRIAVLPVGYADGYPRALSGRAHVLLGGRRAPVRGRICMNLCMVDVTHVPEVEAGAEAVLLGAQGDDRITAEQLADWLGTIAYEVLTLPRESWRREEA